MQTKYVLGLVLSCALLQVSLSQCVAGEPSAELIEKYNDMKQTFFARLSNAGAKIRQLMQPALQSPEGQEVLNFLGSSKVSAATKFMEALFTELQPLSENARTAMLGKYESCLRPQIGDTLSELIDAAKIYLDLFMPVA